MTPTQLKSLAALLYPSIGTTPEYFEEKYPPRNLPEGAKVTRFAPSPTGFVHFGGMFPSTVSERLAHQSGGVFFLRIEDTDSKREVDGAEENIIKSYNSLGIMFDEGVTLNGETGAYGHYRQSDRKQIYQTYAKKLIEEGKAYPCFCAPEQLDAVREEQEKNKELPGYYGKYAVCRELTYEQIAGNINAGKSFVLRLRSTGDPDNKIKFTDLVKGNLELTENNIDHILLKSDGMPSYHFAHAVDDHLMRTTHVVRGEEWLPSLPYHIQIFAALGFRLPKYLHISQLMRMENGAKKKLSKRDNCAALSYYNTAGYPAATVREYVMTLLNSNFEDWRRANPAADINDFPFSIKKMSGSGCLFDFDKLNDVSKNVISRMSAHDVYVLLTEWAKENDPDYYALLTRDSEYAESILSIGRGGAKPRKDLTTWADAKQYMNLFYDELFGIQDMIPEKYDKNDVMNALQKFILTYNYEDVQSAWFEKIKDISESLGYASDMKEYKQNPEAFKGNVGDISMFIRVAVTGKLNSPDMYEVMRILGYNTVINRIKKFIKIL
ncbi:MAG: glutamate--tRNA ligase [Oscillospiraceae bacterium]|nr:glutamate--tRNA ligase [Oscillospiraceae bacterium]